MPRPRAKVTDRAASPSPDGEIVQGEPREVDSVGLVAFPLWTLDAVQQPLEVVPDQPGMGKKGWRNRVAVIGPNDLAEDLRLGALNVLGVTPGRAMDAAVSWCIDHPSPELQMAALSEAQRRGLQSLHAMRPVIATRRDDHDPGVRLAAAEAIAFLPEATNLLVDCLKNQDRNLRACAVAAVAPEMTSAAVGEMIITHVDDRATFLSAVEVQKATNPRR